MVYFIQHGRYGAIKIGKAQNPKKRLAMLQIGNPITLYLIGIMDTTEAAMHAQFSEYHLRNEWYKPHEKLLDFITSNSDENFSVKRLKKHKKISKLENWQIEQGLNDSQLANLLSIDHSYIFRLKNGERRASPDLALLIEQISGGKVSRTEVLYP